MAVELGRERRRHLDGALVIVARHAQQAGIIGVVWQAFRVRLEIIEQPADRRVGKLLMRQLAQGRHLASARRRAARRHIGGLIPAEQRRRRLKIVDFKQAGL